MIHPSAQSETFDSTNDDDRSYLGQTIAHIIHREEAHDLAAEKTLWLRTPSGLQVGCFSDDWYMFNYMPLLRKVFASVTACDSSPMEATVNRWTRDPKVQLTTVGKRVVFACTYFAHREKEGRAWQQAYANHQFHPVIAVMLRAIYRWWSPIYSWADSTRNWLDDRHEAEGVEALKQMVGSIRRESRSQVFQNQLHDHDRKAKDNFRSGCDYITKLFKQHARLLVMRIDVYFRPDAKGWGYSQAANKAITNYLRALRLGRIVPGYLGFIIKRENGISRGSHYHLMVFLDGHLHRSAYHLTRLMGEAWMKRVETDKGSYFNCYERTDFYRYNGLGLVHVSDTKKLIGIRVALWYMSKQDSELKVDDSKIRNFWRGWKVKGDSNRGAPRKNGDGLYSVTRMLGGQRSKYPPDFKQD